MDPHDGHRECPSCLGTAHLKEDVDNPCAAACDLPRNERLHRANRTCSSAPECSRERERSSDRRGHKRPRKHLRDHHDSTHKSSCEIVAEATKRPMPAPPTEGGNTDTQLQILAAVQSLSRRMDQFEALRSSSSSLPPGKEGIPTVGQQSHPVRGAKDAYVLSLLAPHSLCDDTQQSGERSQCEGTHSDSTEVDDKSTMKGDFSLNTLITRVCNLHCLIQLLLGVYGKAYP